MFDTPASCGTSLWSLDLPAAVGSPALARSSLRVLLQAWGVPPPVVDDALLIVTELVTNSVMHAGTPARLDATRTATDLRFGVSDSNATTPAARVAATESEGGRGLALVDALASAWGSLTTSDGKTVWAELRLTVRP